ncbi:hypothetical protein CK507_17550 [Pseudomonas sp. WN033]|nr:hypothetical protein CK507_17550 [Pseudomonas sp. WN033]
MVNFKKRAPLREQDVVFMPRNGKYARLWRGILLALLFLAVPISGLLGWRLALETQRELLKDHAELLQRQSELLQELDGNRQRYQQLEVDLLVARESVSEGREVIHDLEQQLFRLQQDLAQYQGALAPSALTPGLRIQAFELHATESPQVFRYKVMVSRVGSESDTVQARLLVRLQGKQGGRSVTLPLSALSELENDEGLELDFRYFQVVPGNSRAAELTLPEDFEPERVLLSAQQNGKTLVEQTFDWTVTGVRP